MRVHKKNAVIRYMFFNPGDINYFKPVELFTKTGRRGKIKSSLGSHGLMKCFFNDYIN
jgi:pre-rRNA-processing protein TSR1